MVRLTSFWYDLTGWISTELSSLESMGPLWIRHPSAELGASNIRSSPPPPPKDIYAYWCTSDSPDAITRFKVFLQNRLRIPHIGKHLGHIDQSTFDSCLLFLDATVLQTATKHFRPIRPSSPSMTMWIMSLRWLPSMNYIRPHDSRNKIERCMNHSL